jgi:hypothetical protein
LWQQRQQSHVRLEGFAAGIVLICTGGRGAPGVRRRRKTALRLVIGAAGTVQRSLAPALRGAGRWFRRGWRVASLVRPGKAAVGCLVSGSEAAAEVPVEDLRYKMIMALNAADIGNPICEQAAQICAEIAEQYCAQLHVTTTAQVIAAGQRAASQALPARG